MAENSAADGDTILTDDVSRRQSSVTGTADTWRLVEMAQESDPAAFNALIQHVSQRLCAITHRMLSTYPQVKRWEQTDDVLQEVLLKLNRSLREVKPQSVSAFFGLAITLLRRRLIDLSRHYYGVYGLGTQHESAASTQLQAGGGSGAVRFAEPISDLDDWTAFHEAIERLPEIQREAFSLKWYGGLTQQQISELLGVSERTVIRRLISARTLLAGWLADPESYA